MRVRYKKEHTGYLSLEFTPVHPEEYGMVEDWITGKAPLVIPQINPEEEITWRDKTAEGTYGGVMLHLRLKRQPQEPEKK